MMRLFIAALLIGLAGGACADVQNRNTAAVVLLDIPESHGPELTNAQVVVSILLRLLQPQDTLAVTRIDTSGFGEKNVVAKMTLDRRPSVANIQKRAFQKSMRSFPNLAKGGAFSDISGGILGAVDQLKATGAARKYILIFSDLKERLREDYHFEVPFQLSDVTVLAMTPTDRRDDDPEADSYENRAKRWRTRIENGAGKWRTIDDLGQIETIFASRHLPAKPLKRAN
jgi:hypothetical protein